MIDLAGEIAILTGPPGSGKTTAARVLADMPGSSKVHLHADDFWHFIRNGALAPYLPEAQEQNRVVVDALAKAAETYARGGYFVIVDGIVGPWFLEPFEALAAPLHYIVLRPALEAAIWRCRERGGDTLTDRGTIEALWRQFSALGELERHVLATEGQSRRETLDKVVEAAKLKTARYDKYETTKLDSWTRGKVALVGDAAHAMCPALAQGAGCAMVNAFSLSQDLEAGSSVEDSLVAWEKRIRPITDRCQALSGDYAANRSLSKGNMFTPAALEAARYDPLRRVFSWPQ